MTQHLSILNSKFGFHKSIVPRDPLIYYVNTQGYVHRLICTTYTREYVTKYVTEFGHVQWNGSIGILISSASLMLIEVILI